MNQSLPAKCWPVLQYEIAGWFGHLKVSSTLQLIFFMVCILWLCQPEINMMNKYSFNFFGHFFYFAFFLHLAVGGLTALDGWQLTVDS
jgi:hypothetical protein